jgi:hypothetical protein
MSEASPDDLGRRPIRLTMDDREPRDLMLPALERCGCFSIEVQ